MVMCVARVDLAARPELYNVDAVGYESLMLGLFTIWRGQFATREKPNELTVGFSRDGFNWDRPFRQTFLPVTDRQGDWSEGNVQSAGGVCLVVVAAPSEQRHRRHHTADSYGRTDKCSPVELDHTDPR